MTLPFCEFIIDFSWDSNSEISLDPGIIFFLLLDGQLERLIDIIKMLETLLDGPLGVDQAKPYLVIDDSLKIFPCAICRVQVLRWPRVDILIICHDPAFVPVWQLDEVFIFIILELG